MLEAIGIAVIVMLLRATDVSLATLKTIFVIEGRNGIAPALGFFEAIIYVIAASLVFRDLGNPFTIVGFGAGFAMGTSLGMYMAGRLGLGSVTVRFMKPGEAEPLIEALRGASYPLTTFTGGGRDGPVSVIQMHVRKRRVQHVLEVAKPWTTDCFVTVGDEPVSASNPPAVLATLKQMPVVSWALMQRKAHP
jgi:uncharacterized protein YebE (UPF0316 family)